MVFRGLWNNRNDTFRDSERSTSLNGIVDGGDDKADEGSATPLLEDYFGEEEEDTFDEDAILRWPSFRRSYGALGLLSTVFEGEDEEDDDDDGIPSFTADFMTSIERNRMALKMCVFYTVCYLGVATIAFSYVFEQWSIIDSLYFAVSTFVSR